MTVKDQLLTNESQYERLLEIRDMSKNACSFK